MRQRISFIVISLLLLVQSVWAQDIPNPMEPRRIVNDFAQIFTPEQRAALEQKLVSFDDSTSSQIAVVTLKTLDGLPAVDYAQRLGEKWGIGQKGKDNGIVILVKPSSANERGEAAIAVGYGLEGVIPDIIASRIVRNEMIPQFKTGNYYAGVAKAVNVITDLSKGEYTASQYAKKKQGRKSSPFVFILPIAFFLLLSFLRRRPSGYTSSSTGGMGVPPIFFGGFGGGRSGGFDSFSSGSGSFGGFDGGSFGGGGAGGSWE